MRPARPAIDRGAILGAVVPGPPAAGEGLSPGPRRASRPEQIEGNVAAFQHRTLSEDEEAAIEKGLNSGREETVA